MNENDAKWEIDATLKSVGFLRVDSSLKIYRGILKPNGYKVDVELTIPDARFVELPSLKILNREALPVDVVAHIERDERLCFGDKQLLRLDRYKPGGSMLRILEQATETLNKSLGGKNKVEIQQEYPAYWAGGDAQPVTMLYGMGVSKKASLGFEANKGLQLLPSNSKELASLTNIRKAMIVKVDEPVGPTDDCLRPTNLANLCDWLDKNVGQSLTVNTMIANSMENAVYIIQAPNGWYGLRLTIPPILDQLKRQNKLRKVALVKQLKLSLENVAVQRYYIRDATLPTVTSRSLPHLLSPFIGKKILLIGAGTIGSNLSELLVRSGAGCEGTFTIVDPDYVVAGNLGRHTLSVDDMWENKASALKCKLERFHSDVQIAALEDTADSLLKKLHNYDLVIDATGVETVSEDLNYHAMNLRRSGNNVAMLHVWIFGNGISVHSYLHALAGEACYRCLRPDLSKPWRYDSRKDTSKEAIVVQNGCGLGTFVPYSISASVKAAAIAFDSALGYFEGQSTPSLKNHLIDKKRGKRLSHKSPTPSPECPACKT